MSNNCSADRLRKGDILKESIVTDPALSCSQTPIHHGITRNQFTCKISNLRILKHASRLSNNRTHNSLMLTRAH